MIEENIQELDDARLIERAKLGEVEAFGCLYERYLESIYRYIRTRVAEARTAEDLTEIVFLRSFESLSRYKEKGLRFSAFLYQVARNLLVDHYRQEKEELPIESADQTSIHPQGLKTHSSFRIKWKACGWVWKHCPRSIEKSFGCGCCSSSQRRKAHSGLDAARALCGSYCIEP